MARCRRRGHAAAATDAARPTTFGPHTIAHCASPIAARPPHLLHSLQPPPRGEVPPASLAMAARLLLRGSLLQGLGRQRAVLRRTCAPGGRWVAAAAAAAVAEAPAASSTSSGAGEAAAPHAFRAHIDFKYVRENVEAVAANCAARLSGADPAEVVRLYELVVAG